MSNMQINIDQIEWTPELSVQNDIIDRQHQELLDRLRRFAVFLNQPHEFTFEDELESLKLLVFLLDYVVEHFSEEERLMLEADFPRFLAHRRKHSTYIENLYNFKKRFREEGLSPSMRTILEQDIISWLIQHIRDDDIRIGQYLAETPDALPNDIQPDDDVLLTDD